MDFLSRTPELVEGGIRTSWPTDLHPNGISPELQRDERFLDPP